MEQLWTTYYGTDITWWHDQGVTWHVGWGLLILVTPLLNLWTLRLVKVTTKYFWFVTWSLDWSVTWLCGWGSFILSHHPAKFGIHRPCESGDITSLIYHMTMCLLCHVTCGWGSLMVSYHHARFGVHRLCESINITPLICHVKTWSMCQATLWVGSSHPKSPPC